ncbi:hypothetical protein ACEQ8H_001442 [Pleosporales sp. CAS-2024a]
MFSQGPPYAPRYQGLGGVPEIIPDTPISAVLLALYLTLGIIHINIFKANKSRGHKFIFNGAILGLCKIRIVTMSLRIAWAFYPRNARLAIAANMFVYVGTIILFGTDWFFVQRIVRAQHQRLGWSTAYRIFHRGALVALVMTLLMIIVAGIWQSYTTNSTKLHVFRILQLLGQTYFTVFCFAPAIVVLFSGLIPRTEIEKFGAGRLRVNITILLVAVTVLTVGQLFRCVIAWTPQTPVVNAAGRPVPQPWYLHKACFYVFNFATEMIVIIMFALVRVDLRFHIPNGSRMSGDYSGRNSRVDLNATSHISLNHSLNKRSLACVGPTVPAVEQNESNETVHQYETSVFEDSHTLAESLHYAGSTLEADDTTGAREVERQPRTSTSSHGSIYSSSFNDRSVAFADQVPPLLQIPTEWPLTNDQMPHSSMSMNKHRASLSRKGNAKRTFDLANHNLNGVDVGDAIDDALAALGHNSKTNQNATGTASGSTEMVGTLLLPPAAAVSHETHHAASQTATKRSKSLKNPLAPRHRATFPPKSVLKSSSNSRSSTHVQSSNLDDTHHVVQEVPDVSQPPQVARRQSAGRPSSVEPITLAPTPSYDARSIMDMSLPADSISHVSRAATRSSVVAPLPSSLYSDGTTSSDARDAALAEKEYRAFSFDLSSVYSDELTVDKEHV